MSQRLYIIQEGAGGPVKVGIAKRPHGRLKALQTGNARTLFIRGVSRPIKDARSVEAEIHRNLSRHAITGGGNEWFDVDLNRAREAVRDALGIPPRSWISRLWGLIRGLS